jgi:hypothetical protein
MSKRDRKLILIKERIRVRAAWEIQRESSFVRHFTDYAEGIVVDDQGGYYPAPDPLNTALTNSSFRVISWTNLNGVSIPAAFAWELFDFQPSSRVGAIISGVVTDIRAPARLERFAIHFPKPLKVADYRYPDLSDKYKEMIPMEYTSTNGIPFTREELETYLIKRRSKATPP